MKTQNVIFTILVILICSVPETLPIILLGRPGYRIEACGFFIMAQLALLFVALVFLRIRDYLSLILGGDQKPVIRHLINIAPLSLPLVLVVLGWKTAGFGLLDALFIIGLATFIYGPAMTYTSAIVLSGKYPLSRKLLAGLFMGVLLIYAPFLFILMSIIPGYNVYMYGPEVHKLNIWTMKIPTIYLILCFTMNTIIAHRKSEKRMLTTAAVSDSGSSEPTENEAPKIIKTTDTRKQSRARAGCMKLVFVFLVIFLLFKLVASGFQCYEIIPGGDNFGKIAIASHGVFTLFSSNENSISYLSRTPKRTWVYDGVSNRVERKKWRVKKKSWFGSYLLFYNPVYDNLFMTETHPVLFSLTGNYKLIGGKRKYLMEGGHGGEMYPLALSPDGNFLFLLQKDCCVDGCFPSSKLLDYKAMDIWELNKLEDQASQTVLWLGPHEFLFQNWKAAYNPRGPNSGMYMYDVFTGVLEPKELLRAYKFDVSTDGKMMAECGYSDGLSIFNIKTSEKIANIKTQGTCWGMRFQPGSDHILTVDPPEQEKGNYEDYLIGDYKFALVDMNGKIVREIVVEDVYINTSSYADSQHDKRIMWLDENRFAVNVKLKKQYLGIPGMDYLSNDGIIVDVRDGAVNRVSDIVRRGRAR